MRFAAIACDSQQSQVIRMWFAAKHAIYQCFAKYYLTKHNFVIARHSHKLSNILAKIEPRTHYFSFFSWEFVYVLQRIWASARSKLTATSIFPSYRMSDFESLLYQSSSVQPRHIVSDFKLRYKLISYVLCRLTSR